MKWTACLLLSILTAACQRQDHPVSSKAAEPEVNSKAVTNWTTKTELFLEYPPLVAGQKSRFAIHLTRLDNFKPVAKGRVEVRLTSSSAESHVFSAEAPSRPGIFGVDVQAPTGEFGLAIHFAGEGMTDVHNLGKVTSSPTMPAAPSEGDSKSQDSITFLKEQQWTLDFGTEAAENRQLRVSIRVPAEVVPRSGGETEVTVPFDGRLVASAMPVIGTSVRQGQVLASILPPTSSPSDLASLELNRNEVNLALQLARKDRERAERLVNIGAAPAKRLDEARIVEATAEARLKAAETRLAQYEASSLAETNPEGVKLFALRAPISGVIVKTHAAPSANVKAGETLFEIIDLDSVYVSAVVPEAELPRIKNLTGAELEALDSGRPRRLDSLVSIGRVVDPISRTFPVIYSMDNGDRRVAINQAVHVRLLTAVAAPTPVVPESAIIDDGGRPVVFIQIAGEAFARRPVKLGIREGGYVQVLEGISSGERVVTVGAHLIRLAAMSNQVPTEGHVH